MKTLGRELMEIFTLGTVDPITGEETFSEIDMIESTRACTGHTLDWDPINEWFVPAVEVDDWDSGPKLMFAGKPWEVEWQASTPQADYRTLVYNILYEHPGGGRYIAGQLFSRLIHPHMTDEFLDVLAEEFKSSDYHIGKFVRTILNSSAAYSPEARRPCIASPTETFIKMMRLARMDEVFLSADVFEELNEALKGANEETIAPASVFGWEGCGVFRETDIMKGEVHLAPHLLLNRGKGFAKVLGTAIDIDGYTPLILLPETPPAATVDLIEYFEAYFDVQFTELERSTVLSYTGELINKITGEYIAQGALETKLNGLLMIFFNHTLFNMR